MKHFKSILLSTLPCLTIPMVIVPTSCSNKQEIKSYVVYKNESHFSTTATVSKIYQNESFTISFTLNDNCIIDESSSYIRCGYNHSHAFNGEHISCEKSGNKYTYTINKDVVTSTEFVTVYISTYKYFSLDVSETSTTDFEFVDLLTPTPIEDETYYIGFKVLNNKGLDLSKSIVTVGSEQLSIGKYIAYEAQYNETTYTFIRISSKYVSGNIKLNLVAGEAVSVKAKSYPEYSLHYLSKPVKGNNFYCYFEIANPNRYELDTDKAVITVGGTALTTEQYKFYDEYLWIDGSAITGDLSIDLPVKEFFNVYSCDYSENPTVLAVGEKINKGQEYSFLVYPLNNKEILWTDVNSYLTINDTKLTSSDFTYEKYGETNAWKITLTAAQTLGDIYCHFVTQ